MISTSPLWLTPFDPETLQTNGPSCDSGFQTVSEYVTAMGSDGLTKQTKQMAVYCDGQQSVVISRLIFHTDTETNNG